MNTKPETGNRKPETKRQKPKISGLRSHISALLIALFALSAVKSSAVTAFYQRGYNSDGTPQTNKIVLTAYPPAVNGVTVLGTNIIFGAYAITNQPDATGFFSNSIFGGTYKYTVPALGFSTFATIPETTNYISLALCLTNAPVISPASGYAIITNWLGYSPPAGTYSGITTALGFSPATNNPGTNTIVFVGSITGSTNASGYYTNFTYTLTTNTINYQIR
jgi:hypothetical protein